MKNNRRSKNNRYSKNNQSKLRPNTEIIKIKQIVKK